MYVWMSYTSTYICLISFGRMKRSHDIMFICCVLLYSAKEIKISYCEICIVERRERNMPFDVFSTSTNTCSRNYHEISCFQKWFSMETFFFLLLASHILHSVFFGLIYTLNIVKHDTVWYSCTAKMDLIQIEWRGVMFVM